MNIPEQTLMNELNKLLRKRISKRIRNIPEESVPEVTEYAAEKQIEIDPNDLEYQEKDIVRLLLLYGQKEIVFDEKDENEQSVEVKIKIAELIIQDLKKDDISFQNLEYQLIFDEYASELEKGNIPDQKHFSLHTNERISKTTIDLISTPYELSKNWKANHIYITTEDEKLHVTATASLLSFKSKKVDQIILDIQEKIKGTTEEATVNELLEELLQYKTASLEINSKLGRIVTK